MPWKFEAGTPNIAGAIALGTAVDYLSALGMENIHAYEQELVDYVLPKLQAINDLIVYGPEDPSQHAGVIAFNIDGRSEERRVGKECRSRWSPYH